METYYPNDSGTQTYSAAHYYDFNAILKEREMDTQGAVGYVESSKGMSEEEAKQYIDEQVNNYVEDYNAYSPNDKKLDEKVLAYMKGDSNVSLSDLNADQMYTLQEYLKQVETPGAQDAYISYLNDKYEYEYEGA